MTSMQHGGNIYTEQTNAPDLLDFSAWLMIATAVLLRLDGKQALQIYLRDRRKHLYRTNKCTGFTGFFCMADDCNRCFAATGWKAGTADLFARSAETSFPKLRTDRIGCRWGNGNSARRNTCLLWKSSRKANDWRCNPPRTTNRYFDCEQTAVREQPAVCRIGGRSALVAQSAIGGKL